MATPFRIITFEELRDAIEDVAVVEISDSDLADRGLRLVNEDTLMEGLGPSRFELLELETGEQYLVHRLQNEPSDGMFIVATLTEDASLLTNRLLDALEILPEAVTWRTDPDRWEELLRVYRTGGKEEWERRQARTGA